MHMLNVFPISGRPAGEPYCRFALFLLSSCHSIENSLRIEYRFVVGSLCEVLRYCSRLTINVMTNWLSEEINRLLFSRLISLLLK